MRILIDGYIFWAQSEGGISRYWSQLIPRIADIDRANSLFLLFRPGSRNDFRTQDNLIFLQQRSLKIDRFLHRFEGARLAWSSLRLRPDIFHSTYYTTLGTRRVPEVVTVYDMIYELFPEYFGDENGQIFRSRKERVVCNAQRIMVISENTKRDLVSVYDLPESRITVIYPGVLPEFRVVRDSERMASFRRKYSIARPFFLWVGRRGLYKNFMGFLRAFSSWAQRKDFHLVLVGGEDEFSDEEKNMITKDRLNSCIIHIKDLSLDQLASAYSCAHAFVYPSLYEGFGFPILEAMACGAPVIASDASSIPEVAGDAALLFNPKDIDSIVDALERVTQESVRADLIGKGFERVRLFSWDEAAIKTLRVYEEAVGEGTRAPA